MKYLLIILLSLFFSVIFSNHSVLLTYDSYRDILSSLMSVSAIVFAIIGSWVAIVYPKAIVREFGRNHQEAANDANQDANYLSVLVEIILVSATVLMSVLIIQASFPLGKILIAAKYTHAAKIATFFVVFTLVFLQIHAVFRVIVTNYFFLSKLRDRNVDQEIDSLHR